MIDFPAKLRPLFEPKRYKVLYGGRGGAKSWGVARALLLMGAQKPLRILCARETQKSISESVHRLLSDQVSALGLAGFYEIQKATIIGRNGTEFTFAGLRHNIDNIKSVEGSDIVWVEEAQTVSKHSWDVLIPTIRKSGSEIWITFNPELEDDDTYQRFVLHPPETAWVQKIGWQDNPWFPEELKAELEALKARDPDSYLTVYEGHCRQTLDGAIYAQELRASADRITRVPYDATRPVHTFWDLGWSDQTAIWFAQSVGFEFRVIDYYEARHQALPHYLRELQAKPYVYGTDWLPHDGQAHQMGSGRSIQELMKEAGRKVQIVPRLSVQDGINAARTIFPNCWFDAEKCADGLTALRRYRYDVDADGKYSKTPLHDQYSNGADAFRMLAVALKHNPGKRKPIQYPKSGVI